MSNLATDYRPNNFAEVLGQQTAVAMLKQIAKANGVACRAIFLKGSYGSGKTTLARIFAKAMNCQEFKKTGDICNTCSACKESEAKNSSLYYEFDSTVVGNSEGIKKLTELLQYSTAGRRVVVLDECHACSKSALNGLLKLVEEGVPDTIFVFASTEDIMATIKSRSINIEINTIPLPLVEERIREVALKESIEITPSDVELIALRSKGHMRDAMSGLQAFSLVGREAIATSYDYVKEFFIKTLKHEGSQQLVSKIMSYSIVDIRSSVSLFIKNVALGNGDVEKVLQQKGFGPKLLNFFYAPNVQQAMKDEVGMEIVLYTFIEKINK